MPRKENGVVLVSCLVLLLLILALVRISLNASTLEQEKSEIDVDTMVAQENAQIGLKAAEWAIQGKNSSGHFCGQTTPPSGCSKTFAANPTNVISGATAGVSLEVPKENENSWMAQSLLDYANNNKYKGVLNTDSIKECGKQPIWKCVQWNADSFIGERDSGKQFVKPIEYGDITGFNAPKFSSDRPAPEYVIEVIPGASLGIPNKTLVRVTVVGYGRKLSNGKPANAMIQATYMLPEASYSLIPIGRK